MELSAFSVVEPPPGSSGPSPDRLTAMLDLAGAAESGGLRAIWVAEHHFGGAGLCPSPPVLLAAIAGQTERLRLGAMVSVLPFHRPVDLAEEYAMVDQLSGGRLDLGLGSGYVADELEGFGVDPATKRQRFDEHLATLLAAFRGEPIHVAGPRGPPVRLNVRPVQQPHPPLWIAVQRREAVPYVARHGAHLALIPYATLSGPAELAEEIREFRSAPGPTNERRVSVGLHLYAGGQVPSARRAFQQYLDSRRHTQSRFYEAKVARDPAQADAGAVEAAGWALFGDPDEVAQRLGEFERLGVDEVLGIFDFGGLRADLVRASVEALGRAWSSGKSSRPER